MCLVGIVFGVVKAVFRHTEYSREDVAMEKEEACWDDRTETLWPRSDYHWNAGV